jgi:hypothetical protein
MAARPRQRRCPDHAAGTIIRERKPDVAVVYFYEGNDLNNNMAFLERRIANRNGGDLVGQIDRSIAAYPSELFVDEGRWCHFPSGRFLAGLVEQAYAEARGAAQGPAPDDPTIAANPTRPMPRRSPAGLRNCRVSRTGADAGRKFFQEACRSGASPIVDSIARQFCGRNGRFSP